MSCQTLETFLTSIQLERYYPSFLKAGATEQDWHEILQFNDEDLNQFISELNMLPFHSIKLKMAIREIRSTYQPRRILVPVDNILSNDQTSSLSNTREFIVKNATIYGKKSSRPLTSYEEAINRASVQLALENPLLISKKGELFDMAKKKLLEEGYRYKRGSSRSKLKENTTPYTRPSTNHDEASHRKNMMAKRQENAQRLSEKRQRKIQHLQQQVEHTIQYRQATENKIATTNRHDTLTQLALEADLLQYEETKATLTKEISKLKAQERKHQWYERRKLERSSSQLTDEGFCSQMSYEEEDNSYQATATETTTTTITTATTANTTHAGFSASMSPSSSSTSSFSPYSSQEYNINDDDSSIYSSPRRSVSSHSSAASLSNLMCSPRESDVRTNSIPSFYHHP